MSQYFVTCEPKALLNIRKIEISYCYAEQNCVASGVLGSALTLHTEESVKSSKCLCLRENKKLRKNF